MKYMKKEDNEVELKEDDDERQYPIILISSYWSASLQPDQELTHLLHDVLGIQQQLASLTTDCN